MTDELQKLLDAVKKYKLTNGRYEYLKRKRSELLDKMDAVGNEIESIDNEIQGIDNGQNAWRMLSDAAINYPFPDEEIKQ